MANTCVTLVYVNGPRKDIKSLAAQLKSVSGEVSVTGTSKLTKAIWTGDLWAHLGVEDPAAHGNCAAEITGISVREPNQLAMWIDSKWRPMLGPVIDLVKKYAPDSAITYFAMEPMANVYVSNAENHVSLEFDFSDDDPLLRPLQDWDTIQSVDECAANMAGLLHVDPAAGFEAIAEQFCAKYPVRVIRFTQAALEKVR